jgi:hypothetical protein
MAATVYSLDIAADELRQLEKDPTMQTVGAYSPTAFDYPDQIRPFSEVHLEYLRKNKHVNPEHYISNLKIMLKKR